MEGAYGFELDDGTLAAMPETETEVAPVDLDLGEGVLTPTQRLGSSYIVEPDRAELGPEMTTHVAVPEHREVMAAPGGGFEMDVVVRGDIDGMAEHHHPQGDNARDFKNTSGLVAAEGILNQFGVPVTESDLVEHGVDNGLVTTSSNLDQAGATTASSLAEILAGHGVPARVEVGWTAEELAREVESGHGVIVKGVDLDSSSMTMVQNDVVVTGVARDCDTGGVVGFYVNDPADGASAKLVPVDEIDFGDELIGGRITAVVSQDVLPAYAPGSSEPDAPPLDPPVTTELGPADPVVDGLDEGLIPGADHTIEPVLEPELEPGTADDARPNFDPQEATAVVGNPVEDMSHWHQQATDYTCAVVSQEFILETLTGQEFSEEELALQAIERGWLTDAGTAPDDVGKLLELHGLEVERSDGNSLEDLIAELENGGKVMVGLDADEIWTPGQDAITDDLVMEYEGGIPGQDGNHAVEVIGVDNSNPNHPMVILNDPGLPDGQGIMIPAEEFVGAWDDANNFMVTAMPPKEAGELAGISAT